MFCTTLRLLWSYTLGYVELRVPFSAPGRGTAAGEQGYNVLSRPHSSKRMTAVLASE